MAVRSFIFYYQSYAYSLHMSIKLNIIIVSTHVSHHVCFDISHTKLLLMPTAKRPTIYFLTLVFLTPNHQPPSHVID